MKFSMTYQGVTVMALACVLRAAGTELPDAELAAFVATGLQVLGALMALYGRFRHGDLTWFGAKK
jgi:hypothetical protein